MQMRPGVTVCCSLALATLLTTTWLARLNAISSDRKLIRFSYVGSPVDPRHATALRFKKELERLSHGAIHVELFGGGQLGGDRDAIEGVRLGTFEMTVSGAGIFANFEPVMGVTAVPFLFDGFDDAWAYLDSTAVDPLEQALLKQRLHVLGYWENGFRCITNSVRPVREPADLAGLSIRTPENPLITATLIAMGANASPLPWPELYMALQQQAYDGQENPIPVIYLNNLFEVQEYLSITNHTYEPMPLVINEAFWQRLNSAEQSWLVSAAQDSQQFNRELVRKQSVELQQKLAAAGMEIITPDRQPFREATAQVRGELREAIGAKLLDDAETFLREFHQNKNEEP